MSNIDPKLVLNAYRPDGADAWDPFFRTALEQAKRDPQLMAWFSQQRAFDAVIVSKLRTIEPPAGLKLQILGMLHSLKISQARR